MGWAEVMKVMIPVQNSSEATAISAAMADPATRALVVVLGSLLQLPTDRARRRVLAMVKDKLDEEEEAKGGEPGLSDASAGR